jgi:hypothetical protein
MVVGEGQTAERSNKVGKSGLGFFEGRRKKGGKLKEGEEGDQGAD